jgi:hypothetical protein
VKTEEDSPEIEETISDNEVDAKEYNGTFLILCSLLPDQPKTGVTGDSRAVQVTADAERTQEQRKLLLEFVRYLHSTST